MPNNDVQSVLGSQDYYRLKTEIQSPGDIFEIDVSARAIYVGPDSDISDVRIDYYDPREPLGMQTADISVNGPFVGTTYVDLTQEVVSTGQPGRILAYPVDIVNPNYARPLAVGDQPTRVFRLPIKLDLIFALQELPSIPSVRADRPYRFPNVPFEQDIVVSNGSTDIILPVYGRRMITCQIVTAEDYFADFYLVALQPGANNVPQFLGGITHAASSDPETEVVVIKASDSISQIDGTRSDALTYTELLMPLPSVKGMGDLLIVNIGTTDMGAGLRFADVFLKLSDRED